MKDSSEDLSIRARRGELDENATKQLTLLLSSSLEARLVHRAGREFDAQDSVLPGDEALAQRITERLLLARPIAPRLPRRWLKSALTAGGMGALMLVAALSMRKPRPEPVPSPSVTQKSAPVSSVSTPAALPGAADSARPAPSPAQPPARKSAAELAPMRRALGASDSASALFARANRARREAEPERAVALYERLQQRFPSAPEALASELALGLLKLQLAEPDAALRHFSAYLSRAPQGELGSEALWGQARAYLALGQKDLAKKSFRLLLSQYPESAYAGAARAKLQALP